MIFLFFILFIFNVQAKVVKMSTVNWPPFFGPNLKGEGLVVRLIEESLKVKGHKLTVNYMPWARAMGLAKRGKKFHALLGCFYTKEREKSYNYSKEITSAAFHFLLPKNNSLNKISSPSQLKNIVLGKGRKYATSQIIEDYLKKKLITVIEVSKIKQLFSMIERGRVNVMLENPLVARYQFKKLFPKKAFPLKDAGPDFPTKDGKMSGGLFICWSKKNQEVKSLLPQFNEGLKMIKANGVYDKVRKEFGLE